LGKRGVRGECGDVQVKKSGVGRGKKTEQARGLKVSNAILMPAKEKPSKGE